MIDRKFKEYLRLDKQRTKARYHGSFLEQVNGEFGISKRFVENELGIKLTNIEGVELKKLVEYTVNIFRKDAEEFGFGGEHAFHPDHEAAYIFMNRNYGLDIRRPNEILRFIWLRDKDKKDHGYDWGDSFKLMQEEMHFP
jgi:hypothetical protein